MPVKKRPPKRTAKNRATAKPRRARAAVDVQLPTQKSEPLVSLDDYAMMVYGDPGCGKTTLAGEFDKCIHLMFEPGGKAYRLYQVAINEWPEAVAYAKKLASGDHDFKTVCTDTTEAAYDLCFDWCCKNKLNGQHPNDMNDRGKSWRVISDEFKKNFFHVLLAAPVGTYWTSHVREVEIERRDGTKYMEFRPNLSGAPWSVVEGLMDIIGFYEVDATGRRQLNIVPDGTFAAKNRLKELFLTTSGEPVESIPMGESSEEARQFLVAAFNNEQATTYAYAPDARKGGKKPPKKRVPKKAAAKKAPVKKKAPKKAKRG